MLVGVCLLLGIYTSVFANNCKDIKPMDHFSLEKFTGDWHLSSKKYGSTADEATYKDISCGIFNLGTDAENKPTNWTANFLIGGKAVSLGGKYTIPDHMKGFMKVEFPQQSVTYDLSVKCTDYETYSIIYLCVQITPAESSEILNILTKDPMKYDEIIALPEVKECFADISSKPLENELQKIPSDNCPNLHKG